VTQTTAQCSLYNSTDGVAIQLLSRGTLIAADFGADSFTLKQTQASNLGVTSIGTGGSTNNGIAAFFTKSAFSTAWTGAWTLSLRHGGVTSGGTFEWSWSVYRVKGQ